MARQVFNLFHGGMMKFLHGFVADWVYRIAGITSWTSVLETAVDFVCGMRFFVVAVNQIRTDTFLAALTCVLNIDLVLIGGVRPPFVRKQGLSVLWRISQWWNDGDRIFGKVIGAIHKMAGQRDNERCKRIDVGNIVKQFAKF